MKPAECRARELAHHAKRPTTLADIPELENR